jgi:hypothetical protein
MNRNMEKEQERQPDSPVWVRDAVLVQCRSFRCMAYRDSAGTWRNYFNDDELQGEVRVLE